MRGAKETRACAQCGNPLTRLVSQAKGKLWFCDHACQMAHHPIGANASATPNPYRGQQETRPCIQCGAAVTRFLSSKVNTRPWTCSYHCKNAAQAARRMEAGAWVQPKKPRRGETVACLQCGTEFYREPSQTRAYCSQACVWAAQSLPPVIKACEVCGAELRLKPSQAARRYCSNTCQGIGMTKRPLNWTHNGRLARKDQNGYVMVYEPEHPNKSFHGWQYQHRLVVEAEMGRYLTSEEIVHHINSIKDDNDPANLQVVTAGEHSTITHAERIAALQQERTELAEYRRRYGPLTKET